MAGAARLAPLDPPYDPEIARTLERLMGGPGIEPLRLFRVVAHNAHLLEKLRSSGSYLLNFGTVDPLEREIVIHRTCARCGSEYEWGVHVVAYGRRLGLSEEQIAATVNGDAQDPVWTERQSLLIRLADELHDSAAVSDDLWEALAKRWSPAQLVELVTLAGQYHTISFLTNAFRVAPEEYGEGFPVPSPPG